MSMIGRMVTPGRSRSIISCDSPAWRSLPASVRSRVSAAWLLCAPLVQTFWPLTFQPSAVFSANVRTLARSEPEFGSDSPMQA